MTETTTKTYLFHEISSYLPLLEGEEFDALVEDIKQFGQIEPAVLFEGKIIDGRNRYRACKQLDIDLKVREWNPSEFTGMTPLQFVISENIMRRHLNETQRSEIGLLLLPEVEKESHERKKMISSEVGKITGGGKKLTKTSQELLDKKMNELSKGSSTEIVAKKVKVSPSTIQRAKKIKEIAEEEPLIAEEWEKAKREETGIRTVYEKAKIIESITPLPKPQQNRIIERMTKGEATTKQIKEEVQDLKDNIKRADIAKRNRAMEKKKVEKEKLHLKINEINKSIYELENAFKSSEATLNILSNETVEKYPHIESKDSAFVLTHLGVYYDTLDMEIYDEKLKELRSEYDVLEKPLRDKLAILESEYTSKKSVIDKQKKKKNVEVSWIEKQQTLMVNEFDKQVLFKGRVEKLKKEVAILQEKYDDS